MLFHHSIRSCLYSSQPFHCLEEEVERQGITGWAKGMTCLIPFLWKASSYLSENLEVGPTILKIVQYGSRSWFFRLKSLGKSARLPVPERLRTKAVASFQCDEPGRSSWHASLLISLTGAGLERAWLMRTADLSRSFH